MVAPTIQQVGTYGELLTVIRMGSRGVPLQDEVLRWAREFFMAFPKRCAELVLVDANTHVGAVPAQSAYGDLLLGTAHAAAESRMAIEFRAFLLRTGLQAVNTMGERGRRGAAVVAR